MIIITKVKCLTVAFVASLAMATQVFANSTQSNVARVVGIAVSLSHHCTLNGDELGSIVTLKLGDLDS
jgi:hypothetical protein